MAKQPRFDLETADRLFEDGENVAKQRELDFQAEIDHIDQLPAIARVKSAIADSKNPSSKIVAFPTDEYCLEHGMKINSDNSSSRVWSIMSITDPNDRIDLLPSEDALDPVDYSLHGIDSIIERSATGSGNQSLTSLVDVYGPSRDPSRAEALYEVIEGDVEMEKIYLLFSGAYINGMPVKKKADAEVRSENLAILRRRETKERAQQVGETALTLF